MVEPPAAERADVRDLPTPVLALVPHADDETLGCGGLLASLFAAGASVHVVLVTDGAASHPASRTHSPAQRRDVREREFLAALAALGGRDARVTFWRKPDGALPDLLADEREAAVAELAAWLREGRVGTLLTPWRRDPHGDHVATTAWARDAVESLGRERAPVVLEYRVWTGHQGDDGALARSSDGVRELAFDVRPHRGRLRAALAAHASQLGNDVFADPGGFTLPTALAATVEREREVLLTAARPPATLDAAYFARVYRDADDPWGFATSDYERRKYDDTLASLPRKRYGRGLELGCSVGVLTERLADRCGELIATEIDPRALAAARRRCGRLPHVRLTDDFFPRDPVPGPFDLILVSEVAYYWGGGEFTWAVGLLLDALAPGGHLALVHYTPVVTDYPLTGDEVHEGFLAEVRRSGGRLLHLGGHRAARYRLDVLERR